MSEEEWRLDVSKILGKLCNEQENNREDHKQVRESLHDIKDSLSGLPCTKHTADIAVLKNKFSKPYLIGILVTALIPAMFLFLKFRDLKIDFTREAMAIQKTQIIFEKFLKKNGHLLEMNDELKLIEEAEND